jgi:general secretion pathway protein D
MMKFNYKRVAFLVAFFISPPIYGQTIAEKKANLQESITDLDQESEKFLPIYNEEMSAIQKQLQELYAQVNELFEAEGACGNYQDHLAQINALKQQQLALQNTWRNKVSRHTLQESYGLWLAPETTLEQLVIDYGAQDYVYLIPAEVGSVKLSVDSNLPIPRASWAEMLELILAQNGVGIRTLSPFLRQLYFFKANNSILKAITNKREELEVLSNEARIGFLLSPEPSEVRRAYVFLEKFLDQVTTSLHLIGRDILIIGTVSDVQDLLKLYDFVASNRGDKEYRLVPLFKINAAEMAKILEAIFDREESPSVSSGAQEGGAGGPAATVTRLGDGNGLNIIALEHMARSLFLVGTKAEIRKAEEVIRNVESQLSGARERVVFWYTTKNSDAEELAEVLQKVYYLMVSTGTYGEHAHPPGLHVRNDQSNDQNVQITTQRPPLTGNQIYTESFYQDGGYLINPAPAQPGLMREKPVNEDRDNFIVDAKTGAIVMVVEADALPRLKDLLKKLDVPKKMVQIETLLFERRVSNETNYGLNLLKIGSVAQNINATSFLFNNIITPTDRLGITQFLFSRKKTDSGIPAFDLAYRFLLSQTDIQINASPSILAVNQTPAVISIVDEISINTGIFTVETTPNTLKNAFTRAQYGITIEITPTIHMGDDKDDDEESLSYVTLDTDVTFDTIQPGGDPSRPDVTRRHITNQVQIPDGQTVILGGLRRKQLEDERDGIPFIGELPGIGKLFSTTALTESSTEMFIFITPKIVSDPAVDLARIRCEQLSRRPGDLPCFLARLQDARIRDKFALMHRSMRILCGLPREGYFDSEEDIRFIFCDCEGEYDGN